MNRKKIYRIILRKLGLTSRDLKGYFYLIGIFGLLVLTSYILELRNENQFLVSASTDTQAVAFEEKELPVKEVIVEKEIIKPYIITNDLPKDYNDKKEMIHMYLRYLGESEESIATWDRIIQTESKYDENSKAPTYWKVCSDGRMIELKLYDNGVWWQDYCENYGLNETRNGQSKGLLHIIEPTEEWQKCEGDMNFWQDELKCGIEIRDNVGWNQWASY